MLFGNLSAVQHTFRPPDKSVTENYFSYFSQPIHTIVGAQKNDLIETVLLGIQNTCLNG